MSRQDDLVSRGGIADRIAIALSGLCLVHCLTSLLLVTLAVSLGSALLDPLIHEIGLALAIGLGLFAFTQGLLAHRRMKPLLIGALGLCAMGLALLLGHGHAGEVPLTVLGLSLVALGHHLNRRAVRRVGAGG